jgi:hypothetical protein
MIKQYIRDKNRQRIGLLVAIGEDHTKIRIGWSLCNIRKDNFDPILAERIAYGRASEGRGKDTLPRSIEVQYGRFVQRTQRYFHGRVVNPKGTNYVPDPRVGQVDRREHHGGSLAEHIAPSVKNYEKPKSVRQLVLSLNHGTELWGGKLQELCVLHGLRVASETPGKILSTMCRDGEIKKEPLVTGTYRR